MRPLRVLIADDHRLVRAGIRALLDQLGSIEVVGEAANGREALELADKRRPDIVLMDITMPELNGLEVTERLKKQLPHIRVLLLSMHADEAYVSQALAVGAAGYVLKDAGAVELELAIQAAARGESYLSPAVAKLVVSGRAGPESRADWERLTPRQRETLQLIAEGHSTKEIAQKLDLSVKTVETHRTKLIERLDIHDVAGLV